jgi:hypothetical protein
MTTPPERKSDKELDMICIGLSPVIQLVQGLPCWTDSQGVTTLNFFEEDLLNMLK